MMSMSTTGRHETVARPDQPGSIFLVPILLVLLTACGNSTEQEHATAAVLDGPIFGTFYQITLPGDWSDDQLQHFQSGIRNTLEQVDAAMSTYREDSELNRLNAAPVGEWLPLSGPLFEVLSVSQQIARDTGGAFDVTVGGLVTLWGFGPEGRPERVPTPQVLEEMLPAVGHTRLELDHASQSARRLADFYVDLSGVAKGYGVDAVGRYLDNEGVDRYLVSIGGDLLARGDRGPDRPWQIGIEHPGYGAGEVLHVIPLTDLSAATSGDYHDYYERDGQRYSHIIDPRTGYPVSHRLASVTVLHPSNTRADAYATGLMVMGTEQSIALAQRLDLKVLLISRTDEGFETTLSPAMREYIGPELSRQILIGEY